MQSAANEYAAYKSFWEIKINMAAKGKPLEKTKFFFFFLIFHFLSALALANWASIFENHSPAGKVHLPWQLGEC